MTKLESSKSRQHLQTPSTPISQPLSHVSSHRTLPNHTPQTNFSSPMGSSPYFSKDENPFPRPDTSDSLSKDMAWPTAIKPVSPAKLGRGKVSVRMESPLRKTRSTSNSRRQSANPRPNDQNGSPQLLISDKQKHKRKKSTDPEQTTPEKKDDAKRETREKSSDKTNSKIVSMNKKPNIQITSLKEGENLINKLKETDVPSLPIRRVNSSRSYSSNSSERASLPSIPELLQDNPPPPSSAGKDSNHTSPISYFSTMSFPTPTSPQSTVPRSRQSQNSLDSNGSEKSSVSSLNTVTTTTPLMGPPKCLRPQPPCKYSPIVVITGPGPLGKTEVLFKVMNSLSFCISFAKSLSTRTPLANETSATHYTIISTQDFQKMIKTHQLIEHAFCAGYYYGTSWNEVSNVVLECQKVCLLDLDMYGAKQVKTAVGINPVFIRLYASQLLESTPTGCDDFSSEPGFFQLELPLLNTTFCAQEIVTYLESILLIPRQENGMSHSVLIS
ncbi:putative Guanylate kinase [Blattamonas nauphoetae]|uniref:Guanylate kinase n=1 Tax=Blattamonas nauphoetae TaxID=2049346 RepID=A0ABQ9YA12_9EUKA|nr:putative Guanylate kinase [Blattamonas nauphoetae]